MNEHTARDDSPHETADEAPAPRRDARSPQEKPTSDDLSYPQQRRLRRHLNRTTGPRQPE